MQYQRLGTSGLIVSVLGLGTNNFGRRIDLDRTRIVINAAIEHGITFFDTADIYGIGQSEDYIGTVLAEGNRRHDVLIATKFAGAMGDGEYMKGGSRKYIFDAAEASLKRLRTDYIDLYQVHFPQPNTPILETLDAMNDLVRQGKVRYIGHCNFSGWQTMDAQWTAKTEHLARPISSQVEYSLIKRKVQDEVIPASMAAGLGLIPYFPLASGFLTGKFHPGHIPAGTRLSAPDRQQASGLFNDAGFALLGRLEQFAQERGHTVLDLAIGWLLSQPVVGSVIAGATSAEQIAQNTTASAWRLTADEMETVKGLL